MVMKVSVLHNAQHEIDSDMNLVSFTKVELWTNIHIGVAILCSCLPTYRPLVGKFSTFLRSLRQRYTARFSSRQRFKGSEEGTQYPLANFMSGNSSHYKEFNDRVAASADIPRPTEYV